MRRIYQIPRQTLADKIKGRRPPGYCKPGPQAVLGTDVESKIETWLLENFKYGFPLSREAVEFSVKHIVEQIPESARSSIPFKNNTPGKGWFKSFRKRHPQVVLQYYESPYQNKSLLTDDDTKLWHDNVELLLKEKNCSDLIQDQSRIWVMTEFILALNQDTSLSLLEKKKTQKMASKSYSDNTFTVFLTTNALGKLAPPLIITKNPRTFDQLAEIVTGKWGVLSSESCLLTSETFYEYVTSIFYPHLLQNNVVFPVVVFVNEDFFCTSLPLTEFCKKNDIIFLGMPRNATRFLNPLNPELGFPFEMLKNHNATKLCNRIVIHHPIVSLVEDLLTNVDIERYIVDKFHSCNIYPFGYVEESYTEQITHSTLADEQSTIVEYFESKIPQGVVKRFQNCKAKKISWNGPSKYIALYEFWLKASNESTSDGSRDDEEDCFQSNENFDDFIVEEEIEIC